MNQRTCIALLLAGVMSTGTLQAQTEVDPNLPEYQKTSGISAKLFSV